MRQIPKSSGMDTSVGSRPEKDALTGTKLTDMLTGSGQGRWNRTLSGAAARPTLQRRRQTAPRQGSRPSCCCRFQRRCPSARRHRGPATAAEPAGRRRAPSRPPAAAAAAAAATAAASARAARRPVRAPCPARPGGAPPAPAAPPSPAAQSVSTREDVGPEVRFWQGQAGGTSAAGPCHLAAAAARHCLWGCAAAAGVR